MQYEFTSGAQRALIHAACWSAGNAMDELLAPALLLGLLAESECRAAMVLAQHGVCAESVREQWPEMTSHSEGEDTPKDLYFADNSLDELPPLSSEVKSSLAIANRRMRGYEQPVVLATEHLLLGLAASGHETAEWLASQGLDADRLEEEIHQQYGHQTNPLPAETEPLPVEEVPVGEDSPKHPHPPPADQPVVAGPDSHRLAVSQHAAPSDEPAIPIPPTVGSPAKEIGLLRVLDAGANRARESLRVLEDFVRFVLDDRHLTSQFKQFRHELAGGLAKVSVDRRLAARETLTDVGTALATPSEYQRSGIGGILVANFSRLQESLRSLEEYAKLRNAEAATCCERLRYRAYTLQRAVHSTLAGAERLDHIRLYVIVDGGNSADEFAALVRAVVAAGADAIQLRDKRACDGQLLQRARLLREITASASTLFIMNDRPDLAVLSGADGVHVGQEELTVKDARTVLGPEGLIGVSTHSIEQARCAVLDGANYIGVGPTFPSRTKHFDEFPGLELLGEVADEIQLPAFAIGGITLENIDRVVSHGLRRAAVSGAVTGAADPSATVRQMLAILRGGAAPAQLS